MHRHNSFYSGEPHIDTHTARMIITSQIAILGCFEQHTRPVPDAEPVAEAFMQRRDILVCVQKLMTGLVDAEQGDRNTGACWQQGEVTTSLRRLLRDRTGLKLSAAQWQDLATASHDVTRNLATPLRRELTSDTSSLRIEDPTKRVGRTRVYRHHPLDRALADLAHLPAPSTPVAKYSVPLQRAALRTTLDVTPTAPRCPSPYPTAASIVPGQAR